MGIEVSILRYKFPKYFYVFTIFSMYDIAMLDVVGGTKNILVCYTTYTEPKKIWLYF